MDDADGSTTPPLPPAESPDAHLPDASPQSQSLGAETKCQHEKEGLEAEHGETGDRDARINSPPRQSRLPRPPTSKTSEPRVVTLSKTAGTRHRSQADSLTHAARLAPERSATPDTPGTVRSIASCDWDDLEARFEAALTNANQNEQALMAEFEALVRVRNYIREWQPPGDVIDKPLVFQRLGFCRICPRQ